MAGIKLTNIQRDVLESAAVLAGSRHFSEWFTPCLKDTAAVIGRVSTCKALCGRGLLEYRVHMEATRNLPAILEFRITESGQAVIAEMEASKAE